MNAKAVQPILLGPGNALLLTGWSWRYCRDQWEKRGGRFVGFGSKRAIVAAEFLTAMNAAENDTAANSNLEQDPAADFRALLEGSR